MDEQCEFWRRETSVAAFDVSEKLRRNVQILCELFSGKMCFFSSGGSDGTLVILPILCFKNIRHRLLHVIYDILDEDIVINLRHLMVFLKS